MKSLKTLGVSPEPERFKEHSAFSVLLAFNSVSRALYLQGGPEGGASPEFGSSKLT